MSLKKWPKNMKSCSTSINQGSKMRTQMTYHLALVDWQTLRNLVTLLMVPEVVGHEALSYCWWRYMSKLENSLVFNFIKLRNLIPVIQHFHSCICAPKNVIWMFKAILFATANPGNPNADHQENGYILIYSHNGLLFSNENEQTLALNNMEKS